MWAVFFKLSFRDAAQFIEGMAAGCYLDEVSSPHVLKSFLDKSISDRDPSRAATLMKERSFKSWVKGDCPPPFLVSPLPPPQLRIIRNLKDREKDQGERSGVRAQKKLSLRCHFHIASFYVNYRYTMDVRDFFRDAPDKCNHVWWRRETGNQTGCVELLPHARSVPVDRQQEVGVFRDAVVLLSGWRAAHSGASPQLPAFQLWRRNRIRLGKNEKAEKELTSSGENGGTWMLLFKPLKLMMAFCSEELLSLHQGELDFGEVTGSLARSCNLHG